MSNSCVICWCALFLKDFSAMATKETFIFSLHFCTFICFLFLRLWFIFTMNHPFVILILLAIRKYFATFWTHNRVYQVCVEQVLSQFLYFTKLLGTLHAQKTCIAKLMSQYVLCK